MDATPNEPSELRIERLLAHSEWLNALARKLVGDPSAADDLVQDAWCAALERDGRPLANERGWLAAVLANLARRTKRGERARKARERSIATHEAIDGPETLVERAEAQRKLLAALLSLDEPYRSTLLARYVEGSTPARIAATSGVNESTVRTRLARGHAELRKKLEHDHGTTWAFFLAPLAAHRTLASTSAASSTGLFLGAWIMSTTTKVTAAVVVAALAAWFFWPDAPRESVERSPEVASASKTTLDTPRETPSAPVTLTREPEHVETASTTGAITKKDVTASAETSWIELELRRGTAPIANAAVWIAPSMTWLSIDCCDIEGRVPAAAKRALTDANGVARFTSRPGERFAVCFDLRADAERPMRVAGSEIHAGYRHVIELGDASIHGVVYDTRGRPRAGVGLMAIGSQPDVHHFYLAAMARTDERGRYEIDSIAPISNGKYVARTTVVMESDGKFDGLGGPESKLVLLQPGESLAVDFGTPNGSPTLTGRVLNRAGKPFPEGGALLLSLEDGSAGLGTPLDADGRFTAVVTSNTWHARARVAGSPVTGFDLGSIELPAYDTVHDFVVPGARVFGRLYDANGRVLTEHHPWIGLHPKGHDYPAAIRTVVPENGVFAFEGVEPGEWVIGIDPLKLVEGEVVDFTLGANDVEHEHDLHVQIRDR